MAQVDTAERAKSRRVGALAGLRPFLAPYRVMILVAGVALVVMYKV
jgi:ATP-binding cassette subfamily B protein